MISIELDGNEIIIIFKIKLITHNNNQDIISLKLLNNGKKV